MVEKSGGKVALHFCISNFFLIMNFQGCRTDLELWSGGSFVNTEFLMSLLSKIDFLQISQLVLHWYVIDIIFLLIVNDIVKILDTRITFLIALTFSTVLMCMFRCPEAVRKAFYIGITFVRRQVSWLSRGIFKRKNYIFFQ